MTDETAALTSLEPFIRRTAKRYFKGSLAQDAEQEGRLAALLAIRSWPGEATCKLSTHCMRNVWWKIHDLSVRERRQKGLVLFEGDYEEDKPGRTESSWNEDQAAVDAERALMVLEIFNSLPSDQQSAIDERFEAVLRGQPKKILQDAKRTAQELWK